MRYSHFLFLALIAWGLWSCQQESPRPSTSSTSTTPSGVGDAVPLEQVFSRDTQGFAFILPPLKPLSGVGGVRAQDCARCHTEYFQEWEQTTHAHALADLQFQAELTKPGSPQWLCLNCHIPNQDQREHLVVGLQEGDVLKPITQLNPQFDRSFQEEAITCATCHLRQDDQGETVVIGAIGSKLAPHPIRQDQQALRQTCLRCHDPKGESITPNLMCWFETRQELEDNPAAQGQDCVSCHMPSEMGPLVPGMAPRLRHQHHWVGGGVPKTMGGFDSLIARGYESGLELQSQWSGDTLELTLINQSGHALPTADPERYYRIDVLYKRGDLIVQDTSLRIGQIWEWSPARKLGDNRLRGGERRQVRLAMDSILPLSHQEHGLSQSVEIVISHHRLSMDNLKHMQQATVDEAYVRDLQSQIRQMESLYPRFRYTHKLTYSHEQSDSQWILTRLTPQQLVDISREAHAGPSARSGAGALNYSR